MNYAGGVGSLASGVADGINMYQRFQNYQNSRGLPDQTDPNEELRRQQEESQRQQEEARKRAEEAAAIAAQNRQQGGGMNPGAGVGIAKSIMGGGAAGGGEAAAGGTAGASSGSSAAGGIASAGPWALLAATIAVNEYNAKKGGYRSDDPKEYATDLITGKVLSQDVNQRWAPKLFGSSDKFGLGSDMKAGAELSSLDLGSTIKNLKQGTIGKLLGKIF